MGRVSAGCFLCISTQKPIGFLRISLRKTLDRSPTEACRFIPDFPAQNSQRWIWSKSSRRLRFLRISLRKPHKPFPSDFPGQIHTRGWSETCPKVVSFEFLSIKLASPGWINICITNFPALNSNDCKCYIHLPMVVTGHKHRLSCHLNGGKCTNGIERG